MSFSINTYIQNDIISYDYNIDTYIPMASKPDPNDSIGFKYFSAAELLNLIIGVGEMAVRRLWLGALGI